MRSFWFILILALVGLQYKLWLGDGNFHQWFELEEKKLAQEESNEKLRVRNQILAAEIDNLKHGQQALEERARFELGMIKPDEVYYRLVE
jgi:cell division protein FtsB